MNTESFQQSEKDGLIELEEQNEISCLIRRFATKQFGYSRIRISSTQLIQKKPQANVTIALNKSLVDLYLRFGKYGFADNKDKKYIVVARIGFKKLKNGHGTALLKELCIFGEKFGYEYLEVERPNPDCQAFMKKLGFKDEFYLPIDQLKRSIQQYELSKQANVSLA
ncbi:GNAT family N-acetyltransferase [Acinetobacter baumannii]|uniref:GNAT family N-acetyltransferase n=1 Tax=Acinetobacter baumannii TaxID=470 RepID=UPI00244A801C|nr:GNAT family N-acetyltransferase [Acinetobacter baumannii]MDH2597303.1 GNAT family N-acetyltransferase [Acinetobacter baumannii]